MLWDNSKKRNSEASSNVLKIHPTRAGANIPELPSKSSTAPQKRNLQQISKQNQKKRIIKININTIFELFDCTRPKAEQQRGLDLSRHEKCLSVFIRPGYPYGEKIWENCAKAIALRTDQELYYNKFSLLEWLQDLS